MDCSTSGLPLPHHLLEFAQVHVQVMPFRVMEHYSSIKKYKTSPIATIYMDLEGFMPREINKDKYCIFSLNRGSKK